MIIHNKYNLTNYEKKVAWNSDDFFVYFNFFEKYFATIVLPKKMDKIVMQRKIIKFTGKPSIAAIMAYIIDIIVMIGNQTYSSVASRTKSKELFLIFCSSTLNNCQTAYHNSSTIANDHNSIDFNIRNCTLAPIAITAIKLR